jgi:hypothetical protein
LSGPPGALLLALLLLVAFVAPLAISSDARAHTIPGGLTLLELCRAADLVAVARIGKPPAEPARGGALPPVEAEILERLRGEGDKPGKIRFVPHRHADETYREGEEVLLFLQRASRLGDAGAAYQAVEAVADRIVLEPGSRKTWIEATRAYVALGKAPEPAALGRVTLSWLASPEPKIASFALRDLVLAGPLPVVTAADLPALVSIVDDASRPITLRIGVLLEIERRKLVEIGPRWVPLLRGAATPADRVAVIRAAGSRWFHAPLTAQLVTLIGDADPDVAAAAARAVGGEGNEAAVEALGRAVNGERAELRWAALGSLRRIGTPSARAHIERAAASHADPETQRVAQTESRLLGPQPAASATRAEGLPAPASAPGRWKTWALVALAAVVGLGALALRRFRRGADR